MFVDLKKEKDEEISSKLKEEEGKEKKGGEKEEEEKEEKDREEEEEKDGEEEIGDKIIPFDDDEDKKPKIEGKDDITKEIKPEKCGVCN